MSAMGQETRGKGDRRAGAWAPWAEKSHRVISREPRTAGSKVRTRVACRTDKIRVSSVFHPWLKLFLNLGCGSAALGHFRVQSVAQILRYLCALRELRGFSCLEVLKQLLNHGDYVDRAWSTATRGSSIYGGGGVSNSTANINPIAPPRSSRPLIAGRSR